MDVTELRKLISEIKESKQSNKEQHFGNLYPEFKKKYPVMFKLACNGQLDKQNIEFMLTMLEQVQNKEKSQHDASVVVGQMLFDKYVDPQINPQ